MGCDLSHQGDEVGGSSERCLLTDAKCKQNSRGETERVFDCHILILNGMGGGGGGFLHCAKAFDTRELKRFDF